MIAVKVPKLVPPQPRRVADVKYGDVFEVDTNIGTLYLRVDDGGVSLSGYHYPLVTFDTCVVVGEYGPLKVIRH